jgi:hypothetical protein
MASFSALIALASVLTGVATSSDQRPLPPLRAPATPLWVHSPYMNWLMPADNATDSWVWHVRNDKVGSMTAAVRIDGKAFSILGPLGKAAPPPPPSPPAPPGPCCTPGLNFGGGDLANHCPVVNQTSSAGCRALCAATAGCVGFIWDTCPGSKPGCNRSLSFGSPRCWLKAEMSGAGSAEACGCAGFMHKPNPPSLPPRHVPFTGGACPAAHAIPPLPQLRPALVLPTSTVYSFAGSGVAVNLTFCSPKFMEELDSFLPVALVEVSVVALDGAVHDVGVFFEATGQLAVDSDRQNVSWGRFGPSWMKIFHTDGVPLSETGAAPGADAGKRQPPEHLDWGAVHLSALAPTHTWMGSSNVARHVFASSGGLPAADETAMPRPACAGPEGLGRCGCGAGGRGQHNDWPSLAASWTLAQVGATARQAQAVLGSDDLGSTGRYFGVVMGEVWRRRQRSFEAALANTSASFTELMARCRRYDEELVREMVAAGGTEEYAMVGALSYRQVLGDNSVMWYPGSATGGAPTPFMFVKGLGSSGDTGTIDDNYPAALFYLWRNPELLNALLQPINYYMQNYSLCEQCGWPRNQTWQHPFSIHYLGQYPIAELQCWTNNYRGSGACEAMPLEMTADNLQMTAAAAFVTRNFSVVESAWSLFSQYADYLVGHGLDPEQQLCSDDFEGPSPHNANLAAKSIIGIAVYASLCDATNRSCGGKYMGVAKRYARQWVEKSSGGYLNASRRDYDTPGTWSQKYNLIWDRVFGFGLFDAAIARECRMVMAPGSVVRRQFAWYLDDRSQADRRHLTNAGWSEWTAAMCGAAAVEDLYARLLRFCRTTVDRWALSDYFNADTGRRIGFEGRAQMGGFGATVLLRKYPKGLLHHYYHGSTS